MLKNNTTTMLLQARVDLIDNIVTSVHSPVPAILKGCGGNWKIFDVRWALHDVGVQSA